MTEKQIRKLMKIYGINYRIYSRGYNTYLTIKLCNYWTGKKRYYRVGYDIYNIKDEKQLKDSIHTLLIRYYLRFENEETYAFFN